MHSDNNPILKLRSIFKQKDIFFLSAVLILLVLGASSGIRYFLRAESKIILPASYTVLNYVNALEFVDKNQDSQINALDCATIINKYNTPYESNHPTFGTKVNSLELSFCQSHLDQNVAVKKGQLLDDGTLAKRYATDLVVANEKSIPQASFYQYDRPIEYPADGPQPVDVAATPETSGDTASLSAAEGTFSLMASEEGGEGSGSKGESAGRTIIPSVLGAVAGYTGAASFDYPISVPKGPGGIAPNLNISYSSVSIDDAVQSQLSKEHRRCKEWIPEEGECKEWVNAYPYQQVETYVPYYAGYGFSFNSGGEIIRDVRNEKDVYKIKGDQYHRFIINLPSGISAELKYNEATGRWVSIPEGFIKIEHVAPENKEVSGKEFPSVVDGGEWVITGPDGSRYYFGEENLLAKINGEGRVHGSKDITISTTDKYNCERPEGCEERRINAARNSITEGGQGIYNEFEISDLCTGDSGDNPCRSRVKNGKPALLTTKWLLRKMLTADGKSIEYKYNTYQKVYGEGWNKKDWDTNFKYAATNSYLYEVSWNEGKHRVRIANEERPDQGGKEYSSPQRISAIRVETKMPNNNEYRLVREYKLDYSNGSDVMAAGDNPWGASLLKSIREIGTDGATSLPPVTFSYRKLGDSYPNGSAGSIIYLTKINNGNGGVTELTYDEFGVSYFLPNGDALPGPIRHRVREKKVIDLTEANKSFKEVYKYGGSYGFADLYRKKHLSGLQFLGHDWIDIVTYDFNSDKIVSHKVSRFAQFVSSIGDKVRKYNCVDGKCKEEELKGVFTCFEPSLIKGKVWDETVYNHLPNGQVVEASKTHTNYRYRTLDWDKNNNGFIKEDNMDPRTKPCDQNKFNQPYFTYAKHIHNTITEPQDDQFVPDGFERNLTVKPSNKKSTHVMNIEYDLFGNLLKSVSFGATDEQGNDLSPADNRYTFAQYLPVDPVNWLHNLIYASYTSNRSDCGPTDHQCQYGKTVTWYDQFYGNFLEQKAWLQKPKFGLVTQVQTTLATDTNSDGKHDDPTVSYAGTEYLRLSKDEKDHDKDPDNDTTDQRRGGPTRVYGPKPNLKNVSDLAKDIVLMSEIKYDPYYKSLPIENTNALGHKTILDDYDWLLQTPHIVKKQINNDPEKYSVARSTFDSFGRVVATYNPDPDNPGYFMGQPASIAHYFEQGDKGMVTRQMALVSQTKDNALHYATTDTFYDGLGNVKQTQILSKKALGEPKLHVQEMRYNALGQQTETYEMQLSNPVTVETPNANNIEVIKTPAPVLLKPARRVLSKTEYDTMNRPVKVDAYDVDNNFTLTTRTFYMPNATKTIDNKGNTMIATADSLGREVDKLTIDGAGDSHLITTNFYGQEMIDQPTKTTYTSLKDLKESGSTTMATIVYDKAGRVMESNEPSLGITKYEYDLLGNVLVENPAGSRREITHKYDLLGRVVKTSFLNEVMDEFYKNSSSTQFDYVYDTGANALGQLVSVTHPMGKDEIAYDAGGRAKTTKKTIKGKKETKTYSMTTDYNLYSQVLGITYPGGKKLQSIYDEDGVVQNTTLDGKALVKGSISDKFGKPYEATFEFAGKDYLIRTPHDTMGRLKQLGFARKAANTALDPVFFQNFQYDKNSQLTPLAEIFFENGAEKRTDFKYTYDSFSRLISAESARFNATYEYDPFGRMTAKNESEPMQLTYNSSFPFFAPKSVTRPVQQPPTPPQPDTDSDTDEEPTQAPAPTDIPATTGPTRTPTAQPSTVPSAVPSLIPSVTANPNTKATPTPLPYEPEPTQIAFKSSNGLLANVLSAMTEAGETVTSVFNYDQARGTMVEDDKHCFEYNRFNQLIVLNIKKDVSQKCGNNAQFTKKIYFYYDYAGTLVLQEEYEPADMNNPIKKTYYFGPYEEIYETR